MFQGSDQVGNNEYDLKEKEVQGNTWEYLNDAEKWQYAKCDAKGKMGRVWRKGTHNGWSFEESEREETFVKGKTRKKWFLLKEGSFRQK